MQRFLWKEASGYWLLVVAVLSCSFGATVAEMVGLTAVVPLLDSIGHENGGLKSLPFGLQLTQALQGISLMGRLQLVALLIGLAGVLRGVLLFMSTYLIEVLQQNVFRGLRRRAFAKAISLDYQYFHRKQSTALFTVIEYYTQDIGNATGSMIYVAQSLLAFVVYLVCLCFISLPLTLAAAAFFVLFHFVVRRKLGRSLGLRGEKVFKALTHNNNVTHETLNGIRLVRAFSKEAFCIARNHESTEAYRDCYLRQQRVNQSLQPLLATVATTVIAVALLNSPWAFPLSPDSLIPLLVLFFMIVNRLLVPINAVVQHYAAVLRVRHAVETVCEFLKQETGCKQRDGILSFATMKEGIELKDVSFSYEGCSTPCLEEVCLFIPKGKTTAIVGPSGSGKSTLINLLFRFFDPTEGIIEVDGQSLRDFQIATWRGKIALVSQDAFFFDDTVTGNLRFAKEDATQEEIVEAAKLAHAHGFIEQLPQGYNTVVGERGVRLSGGQQQRLAIARAILRRPEILILDEATSHLDSLSEKEIQNALEGLRKHCTIIAIAHRLATVRAFDQIIVLEKGRVVDTGDHHTLVCKEGLYRRLAELQSEALCPVVP